MWVFLSELEFKAPKFIVPVPNHVPSVSAPIKIFQNSPLYIGKLDVDP